MKTERQLKQKIDQILLQEHIPSAAVLHARHGEIVRELYLGEVNGLPPGPDTVYDCASLTKPLITAALILKETELDRLNLRARLGDFNDLVPENLRHISVASLLTHSSGIRPWHPLYSTGSSLTEYLKTIASLPLLCKPEQETHYSCLNYVILAALLERLNLRSYTRLAEERVISLLDLGLTSLDRSPATLDDTAPTEYGDQYEQDQVAKLRLQAPVRVGLIHGVVHDGNAYYVNSRSGNAGLFSTAREILKLVEQWTPRSQLLSDRSRRILFAHHTPWGEERRTVGWQWSYSPFSSAGAGMSESAIGHTGFTGTSAWLDLEKDEAFIILTNRIHPRVGNTPMNGIRREIHNLLVEHNG